MYAILGEDKSDVETINVIIRRLTQNEKLPIKQKGYCGCAELLNKGAKQIKAFYDLGCRRFVVCYDSDRCCPVQRKRLIVDKIINPAKNMGVDGIFCALVPIQELESWILADIGAVQKIITGWSPSKDIPSPESINDPKEYLERLSKDAGKRPRYSHATHNPRVAKYIDLGKVESKCPSFVPLIRFVNKSDENEVQGFCY